MIARQTPAGAGTVPVPAPRLDRPWLCLDLARPMQVLSWAVNRPGLTTGTGTDCIAVAVPEGPRGSAGARITPDRPTRNRRQKTMIPRITNKARHALAAIAALVTFVPPAVAQEVPVPRLDLSLNTAGPVAKGGCRLTFVIRNRLGADIDKLVTEAVLFDRQGRVATLTLFDFGQLPAGRPRVRQFDLAGQGCDAIGQVLINGIDSCEGTGLSPAACLDGLHLSSETDIEVTG